MKKAICIFCLLITLMLSININVYSKTEKPDIKGDAALLIDNSSGKSLYSRNADVKLAPGGFTKIMTAIVAIENMIDKNETVVADEKTLAGYDYSFGNMGLLAGESLTISDLLYGMLLYDAGDAAEVIAAYSLDSRNDFVKSMNEKAVSLGALNTKFTNPSGYPEKEQYSTLEDLSKITKYAMSLTMFSEIVNTGMYEIAPTNKYRQTRYLPNSNKFITRYNTERYYTPKAKGVKSSYIDDNNCGVILQYENNKTSFTILTANSPYDGNFNYAYEDTRELLKYAQNYYVSVKVIKKGDIFAEVELNNGKNTDRILLESSDDLFVNLPADYDEKKLKVKSETEKKIKAPVSKGQALGVVKVLYDGEEYSKLVLTSPQSVEADNIKGMFKLIYSVVSSPKLLVTLGLLLIVFVWSTLIFNRKKQKKKRK